MREFRRCAQCSNVHPEGAPCQGETLPNVRSSAAFAETQMGLAVPPSSPAVPAAPVSATPTPRTSITPVAGDSAGLTAQDNEPQLGQSAGSFVLKQIIGRGGMGTVYLAEHPAIGNKVAIKFLRASLVEQTEQVARFLAEARAAASIGHENIVSIYDVNVLPPNRHYIVMEYLEGETLGAYARDRAVSYGHAVPILTQLCKALQAAHDQGVVHRDIKPDNVFLIRRNDRERFVKLVDFGISKLRTALFQSQATMTGNVMGTPDYMSPEQWEGRPTDGRADIYAVGVLAYRLLTGRLPFAAENLGELLRGHLMVTPPAPNTLVPGVPQGISDAVMKALEKRAEDRFQRIAELGEQLALHARSASSASMGATPTPQSTPVGRSARITLGISAELRQRGTDTAQRIVCLDISRSGAFLDLGTMPPPPLFSTLQLGVDVPSEGRLMLECQVVRHFTAEEAAAWGKPPGAGVEFVGLTPAAKEALDRFVRGIPKPSLLTPAPTARATLTRQEAGALALLQKYNKRIATDPYDTLAMRADSEIPEIRAAARKALEQLQTERANELSRELAEKLDGWISAVQKAVATLGAVESRAAYDAEKGNFRGVARCIGAGLSLKSLEALRKTFLATRPNADVKAREHIYAGMESEARKDMNAAAAHYERGLALDPLNYQLQQRYWKLKHAQV